MADFTEIFLLTCLGLISCSGTTLNLMTIYVLLFNRGLYVKLASVRWLMLGEALADTIACCVGVPSMFANIMVGNAPPYTTVPFLCHINELLGFAMTYVSLWYQITIAMSRLAAVMAPNWFRTKLSHSLGTVLLIVWPWFIGYIGYIVGAIFKTYYISPTPGTGTCVPNQYDDTPAADSRLDSYLFVDSLLHAWMPMALGLMCYVIIYGKMFVNNYRSKNNRQQLAEQTMAPRKSLPHLSVSATGGIGHGGAIHHAQQTKPQLDNIPAKGPPGNMIVTMAGILNAVQQQQQVDARIAHDRTAVTATLAASQSNPIRKRKNACDKKIKLLAISYMVNIILTFPLMGLAWGLDYYTFYSNATPFLARTLDVMYFMAFPSTPVIYVLVSNDFRLAFQQIFKRGQVAPQQ